MEYERQILRKEAEAKREELEDEQEILRGEQNDYRGQLENLLECFNEQVAKVKLPQRELAPSVCSDTPSLLLFSGADPTPKDEANYEQWLFQARGAFNSHIEEAVQSGIISSVRGKVRELIGFIGFQADLMDIFDQVE